VSGYIMDEGDTPRSATIADIMTLAPQHCIIAMREVIEELVRTSAITVDKKKLLTTFQERANREKTISVPE